MTRLGSQLGIHFVYISVLPILGANNFGEDRNRI